jgi:hypothetical protein
MSASRDLVQDHLHHPVALRKGNGVGTHVDQAEGELPPKAGIDETAADEETAARIAGSAPKGGGEVGGELDAFKARYESTRSRLEGDVEFCPEIVGGGLERGFGEGGDYQPAPICGRRQTGPDLSGGKDHIMIRWCRKMLNNL